MLSNVSKKLACLMFAGVMLGVAVAEAGTIPTSSVPLYTYATKKIYCYNSPGGAQKGYIDPGDDITITKVQSNGWVYGNYPTSKGRVSRWFKASDLLADRNANYTRYAPKATTTVYRDSSHRSSMGSVNNNETITVVGGIGNSRQIIYKLSNGKGYKMGWFPYWDAWTYEQAFGRNTPVNNNANNSSSSLAQVKVNIVSRSETTVDTFNGVSAVYPKTKPKDGNLTYNCAGLVKKYYRKVYGVEPYNLLPNSTPRISSSKSFTKVYSPRIGDVVGMKGGGGKENGHWGIVKAIEGNNIILFEQNWRSGSYAYKNRRVSINSVNLYRLQ